MDQGQLAGTAGAIADAVRRVGLELRATTSPSGTTEYLVTGNTYANKELLKSLGARWSGTRRAWVFEGELPRDALIDGLAEAPAAFAGKEEGQERRRGERGQRKRYHGHRERLRQRFHDAGPQGLPDYELLELLLFFSIDVRDTKPLAKDLLAEFGSLGGVLRAEPERLFEMPDLPRPSAEYLEWLAYWRSPRFEEDKAAEARGEALSDDARRLRTYQGAEDWQREGDRFWSWWFTATLFRLVREFAERLGREEIKDRPVISSWTALLDYLRVALTHEPIEQFRLLFLDRKNLLIKDEVQQRGTVDHTPLYPREIVKRALELQASAIIMVHNHPSGDPTPSRADIEMTTQVVQALAGVGITVHDHVIVGKNRHTSFRSQKLI